MELDYINMPCQVIVIPSLEKLLNRTRYITSITGIDYKIDTFYYEDKLCIEIYRSTMLVISFDRYEDLVNFFNQ